MLLFAALLLGIHAWLLFNQGYTFLQLSIPLLLSIVTVVSQLLEKVLPSQDRAHALAGVRHFLLFLLRPRILAVLFGALLAICLFWSSASVEANETEAGAALRLAPAGAAEAPASASSGDMGRGSRQTFSGKDDIARFRTFTLPWGRRYGLRVEGCPARDFTLYPIKPSRFQVTELLEVCRTLLLRVPAELHSLLAVGKIVVRGDGKLIAEVPTRSDQGALLLGRNLPVNAFEESWRVQLASIGMTGESADRSVNNWNRPLHIAPAAALSSEMKLSVYFMSQAGEPLAGRPDVAVGRRRIEDVLLPVVR